MPYADIDGTLLVVTDSGGDGPPVLFCHGDGPGARQQAYDAQISALSDVYRVITSRPRDDLAGASGASEPWGAATTLFKLLDALGIERAVLCGAEDAAETVVRGALLHPDRVRGLALIHARLPDTASDPDQLDDRLEELAMPVLLVHGDSDPERPVALAHAIADAVSDLRGVVEVAGGATALAVTHPDEVTAALRAYLEGLPA